MEENNELFTFFNSDKVQQQMKNQLSSEVSEHHASIKC
jgi:hypothetical protein